MNDEIRDQVNRLNTEGIDMTRVDLEETAIDKIAYQQWRKLLELPQLKNREYIASDKRLIKIGLPKPSLTKVLEGLPDEEIEMFLKKKGVYDTLMMKSNTLKMKAFGLFRSKNKNNPGVAGKLLDAKRIDLLELFGRMFSVQEVHKIVVEEWEIPISIEHIISFRAEHGELIEEKVKAHQAGWADIRLGVKRSRLEEYCWMYAELKGKYAKINSREDLKVMIAILDKIKAETEIDQLNINMSGKVEVEITVNQHIQKEIMQGLGLRQLIVGRVAARMNASPSYLITRLSNSYYAKFATMSDETVDVEYEDVKYPTKEHYNFDEIQKLNREMIEKAASAGENERLRAYQKSLPVADAGVKEMLLKMVQLEKSKVIAVRSNADALDLNRQLAKGTTLTTKEKLAQLLKK